MHISNLILTLIKKYNSLTPKLLSGREKAPSQTISVLYAFLLLQHKQTIQEVEDEDKSEDENGAQKGGPVRSGLSRLGSPAAKVESSHFCWDLPSPIFHLHLCWDVPSSSNSSFIALFCQAVETRVMTSLTSIS